MEELKNRMLSVLGRKFLGFAFVSAMVITCSAASSLHEFYKFTFEIWLLAFGIFAGVSAYEKLKLNGK